MHAAGLEQVRVSLYASNESDGDPIVHAVAREIALPGLTPRPQKCVRCGWSCEAALAMTSVNCTNPDCPFFPAEARKMLDELNAACETLRRVLP